MTIKEGGDLINENFTQIPNLFEPKRFDNLTATTNPTASDDDTAGYEPLSRWINTSTGEIWLCISAATGAANWQQATLTIDELGSAALADIGTASGELIGTDEANDYYGLQYKPSVAPTLSSDFTKNEHKLYEQYGLEPKTLPQTWDVTRASTATRVNALGLIEEVPIDTARIDYDPETGECKGLLVEEQRTNLLTWSEDFSNAAWGKVNATITANAVAAPDGTTTVDKLVESTGTGEHYVEKSHPAQPVGTKMVASIFVKAYSADRDFEMRLAGGVVARTLINANTKTVKSGTGFVEEWGNDYLRVVTPFEVTKGTIPILFRAQLLDPVDGRIYTGDGTGGIYIWGAQLEEGSYPTSYIPTQASAVTRVADIITPTV
jgi:hypothetical protein